MHLFARFDFTACSSFTAFHAYHAKSDLKQLSLPGTMKLVEEEFDVSNRLKYVSDYDYIRLSENFLSFHKVIINEQ